MDEEMVTITKKEYDQLRRDSRVLEALESNGVDNWEWYGDAMASLAAKEKNEDE